MNQQAQTSSSSEPIETRLGQWAAGRDDVRAVVVIGSRARSDHPADSISDLDAILFVDDALGWITGLAWRSELDQALGIPAWSAAFGYTRYSPAALHSISEFCYKIV